MLSLVSCFLFWVLFGSHRWSISIGAFVASQAIVWVAILLIWDVGLTARGDRSHAIGETIVGVTSIVFVQLGLWRLACLAKVQLCQRSDATGVGRGVKRRISIRDLFVWMVAFGILFAVITFRSVPFPKADSFFELTVSGSFGALSAVLTLWLGLGTKLYRIPIAIVGFAMAWWYFDSIDRMDVLQVGIAWMPMLFVTAMVFRWNGYCLQRAIPAIQSTL